MYGLPADYIHREDNAQVESGRRSDRYQREVYARAGSIGRRARSVLDIGCGTGNKLLRHFAHIDTLGLEVATNLPYLQENYPLRRWGLSDFNAPPAGRFDVVICADVVEHISNPDELMAFIGAIDFGVLVISTPARDLLYPPSHNGPPYNEAHCREWAFDEFNEYVSRWFRVKRHVVSSRKHRTQLVEAVKC